jgi:hypothetical protein
MNYLAHHALARHRFPNSSPLLYAGNLLPDLFALYGLAKLRVAHLPANPENDTPLMTGIRLHFDTDTRFHAAPAFKQACSEASDYLRSTPFPTPIRRVFFLAHILVEVALDGYLLSRDPGLAEDLYSCLRAVDDLQYNREMGELLRGAGIVPLETDVATMLERFVAQGWLRSYATVEGQGEALYRICRRADQTLLPEDAAYHSALIAVLTGFAPRIATFAPALLDIESRDCL